MGGGTGGCNVTNQLIANGHFDASEITVFDPSAEHFYQPALTMIGGGVLGKDEASVKAKESKYLRRPMRSMFPRRVNFVSEAITDYNPDQNEVSTETDSWTYDFLIVTPGIKLRFEEVEGMKEALEDPDHPVGSIYHPKYSYKTLKMRNEFKGGNAVFVNPR